MYIMKWRDENEALLNIFVINIVIKLLKIANILKIINLHKILYHMTKGKVISLNVGKEL